MKKKALIAAGIAVVVILGLFMIMRGKSFDKQFQDTTANLTNYLLEGDMEITKGEDIKSYAVKVRYLKEGEEDYFRVALTDKDLNQEQEIIRNKDGIYVVTPSLNQIFKFEGNWPTNSLKPYLLQSMSEIMKKVFGFSSGMMMNTADFSAQNISASISVSKHRSCSSSESRNAFSLESAVDMTLAIDCSAVFSAAPANHFALWSFGRRSTSC